MQSCPLLLSGSLTDARDAGGREQEKEPPRGSVQGDAYQTPRINNDEKKKVGGRKKRRRNTKRGRKTGEGGGGGDGEQKGKSRSRKKSRGTGEEEGGARERWWQIRRLYSVPDTVLRTSR